MNGDLFEPKRQGHYLIKLVPNTGSELTILNEARNVACSERRTWSTKDLNSDRHYLILEFKRPEESSYNKFISFLENRSTDVYIYSVENFGN